MPTRPALLSLLLCIGLATLSACSTFERDWRAAAPSPGAAPSEPGRRWMGTWRSDANGHSGGLRCLLAAGGDGAIPARFRATFFGILRFEYTVPLAVSREGGRLVLTGEADLGWLAGGRYVYEGNIVDGEFTARYRCAADHGTFRMTRIDP